MEQSAEDEGLFEYVAAEEVRGGRGIIGDWGEGKRGED